MSRKLTFSKNVCIEKIVIAKITPQICLLSEGFVAGKMGL